MRDAHSYPAPLVRRPVRGPPVLLLGLPGFPHPGDRRYENTGPDGDQTVTTVELEIVGQRAILLDAGPSFKLDEAFSFFVECETQAEVDEYWDKLTADGGEESYCGWLKDKFGVSWQIIPRLLEELLQDEDKDRANSVMQAMLQMRKIDCAALQRAYDEPARVS